MLVFEERGKPEYQEKNLSEQNTEPTTNTILFEKLRLQNVFRSHENEKLALSNSSGLKSVFEKLRFRDGLVWTVGLTAETKLRF